MWKKPVGLGAKRTRTWDMGSGRRLRLVIAPKGQQEPRDVACQSRTLRPRIGCRRIEWRRCEGGLPGRDLRQGGRVPPARPHQAHAGIRPRIYLSAGIHGDEPRPPLALLSLIESGRLRRAGPSGSCARSSIPTASRAASGRSAAGIDLNRDYRHLESPEVRAHVGWLRSQPNFDLAVCVHEDWESTGFYLYELNPDKRPSLRRADDRGRRPRPARST